MKKFVNKLKGQKIHNRDKTLDCKKLTHTNTMPWYTQIMSSCKKINKTYPANDNWGEVTEVYNNVNKGDKERE